MGERSPRDERRQGCDEVGIPRSVGHAQGTPAGVTKAQSDCIVFNGSLVSFLSKDSFRDEASDHSKKCLPLSFAAVWRLVVVSYSARFPNGVNRRVEGLSRFRTGYRNH